MTAGEAAYLASLFSLVNQAIIERVQALRWFNSGGEQGAPYAYYREQIDRILATLDKSLTPDRLRHVQRTVVTAIREQQAFFERWQAAIEIGRPFRFDPRDPAVQSSHRKLVSAYRELMRLFPAEPKQNKTAFFDHLCALDFL